MWNVGGMGENTSHTFEMCSDFALHKIAHQTLVAKWTEMHVTLAAANADSGSDGWPLGHEVDRMHPWVCQPVTTTDNLRYLRLRMEERTPVWRLAANILNKQSCTADKGWSFIVEGSLRD